MIHRSGDFFWGTGIIDEIKSLQLLTRFIQHFFIQLTAGWAMEGSDKIVVTAREIEKMNVRSMPDLLNQIPGPNTALRC
ncbi:MAG: Plug domain-containing protein [Deltaproteobacteria bacterium]|nr:Plug domain-containing protein [Deltaproteobacteria bacterium]